jgi:hypothetical protein
MKTQTRGSKIHTGNDLNRRWSQPAIKTGGHAAACPVSALEIDDFLGDAKLFGEVGQKFDQGSIFRAAFFLQITA